MWDQELIEVLQGTLMPELWRMASGYVSLVERKMLAHTLRLWPSSNIDQF